VREAPLDLNLKYAWQQAVLGAIMEFHPECLRDKMTAAERAISGRLRQNPAELEELLALRDALVTLQIVFPYAKPQVESLIELTKNLSMKIPQVYGL
jgi:hypothetical protein